MPCPESWTANEHGCYHITPEISSHSNCLNLCGANAALACIGSMEENAALTDMAVAFIREAYGGNRIFYGARLALGTYLRTPGQASDGGWDACPSGEEASFAAWRPGQPWLESINSEQRCATMLASERDVTQGLINASDIGSWMVAACTLEYDVANVHCLCEWNESGAAPEYVTFIGERARAVWVITIGSLFVLAPILIDIDHDMVKADKQVPIGPLDNKIKFPAHE